MRTDSAGLVSLYRYELMVIAALSLASGFSWNKVTAVAQAPGKLVRRV